MSGEVPASSGLSALKRFMNAKRRPPGERCEFCAADIGETHGHVVNVETRALMCVCRACYLLFTASGAARGRYRAVPDRYVDAGSGVFTDVEWDELQIPVAVAFFFVNSALGRAVAFYPSPGGATESLLPLEVWNAVAERNEVVAGLAPDVEALLVRRRREAPECFVVPIDSCYELVGRMRRDWKGFDGGDEVRAAIEAFFAQVREKCPAARAAANASGAP